MSNVNTTDILPILTIIVTASIVYATLIIDTISTLCRISNMKHGHKKHNHTPPKPGQCLVPFGVGGSSARLRRLPVQGRDGTSTESTPLTDGTGMPLGGRGRADLSLHGLNSAPGDRPKGRSLSPAGATWTESPVAPFAYFSPCNVITSCGFPRGMPRSKPSLRPLPRPSGKLAFLRLIAKEKVGAGRPRVAPVPAENLVPR